MDKHEELEACSVTTSTSWASAGPVHLAGARSDCGFGEHLRAGHPPEEANHQPGGIGDSRLVRRERTDDRDAVRAGGAWANAKKSKYMNEMAKGKGKGDQAQTADEIMRKRKEARRQLRRCVASAVHVQVDEREPEVRGVASCEPWLSWRRLARRSTSPGSASTPAPRRRGGVQGPVSARPP
eukprot:1889517-Pyramimonas_sp.AAC.1